MDWIELGQKYRVGRTALGLSIRAAAQNAGVSHQIWDFIERAQRENVLVSTLESMAKAVGADLVIDVKISDSENTTSTNKEFLQALGSLSPEDGERLLQIAQCLKRAEGPSRQILIGQIDAVVKVLLQSPLQPVDIEPLPKRSLRTEKETSTTPIDKRIGSRPRSTNRGVG